ncbi:hypothetical protein ACFCVY_30975 [Streptomyces sp. NPDC056411]|uniref:hypothetical protein n=1 Tax=Streptomyces sp. NPDC056411 TaxID=3345813 RepID=UPI0035E17681
MMPAMVPHCPLRPAGTWGAVIQRVRTEQEPDCILWYCKGCGDRLRPGRCTRFELGPSVKRASRVPATATAECPWPGC